MFRSKVVKEKDRNTKYFYVILSIRKRKIFIGRLRSRNKIFFDFKLIRKEISKYFKKMYKEVKILEVSLFINLLFIFLMEYVDSIEFVSNYEEVKVVVWVCDFSKFLGYDGFNMNFIRSNWE